MNYFGYLDSSGYDLKIDLPKECIDDCSASGPVDDAVAYWIKELKFDASKKGAKDYLKGFGAWDESELANHEDNLARLLWLICGDISDRQVMEGDA